MLSEREVLFYLSVSVLVLGVVAGVRALFEGFSEHEKHGALARSALGLVLFSQTAILVALANQGTTLVLSHFPIYFGLSFLLSFVGFLFIYDAVRSFAGLPPRRKVLVMWGVLLGIFFAFYFTLSGGFPLRAVWNLPALLFAFLPIHLLILFLCSKWLRSETAHLLRSGIALMIAASLILTVRDLIYIARLFHYPGSFWFVVYFSDTPILIMQLAGILLFLLGFGLVHWSYRNGLLEA